MAAKRSRLGVGAAASAGASENVSEDWTKSIKKQILSVGKKRRHDNIYGEDDDDDDAADNNHDNSSSDEEEGRTTAVKERKKKKTVPVSTDASSLIVQGDVTTNDDTQSKKKKKKGKKERIQEKQAAQYAAVESTEGGEAAAPQSSTTPSDKEQTTEVTNTSESKKPNQKRKRPKVRSRQKNIAKDNRKANEKPSHLVLGRDDYDGRPMTQRTREKLGLGKSKSSMKSKKTVKLDNAFEKGEWVGEDGLKEEGGKPESKVDATSGPGAADTNDEGESVEMQMESSLEKIGDCIVDYEPSSSSSAKKKKKKDKKKKKYKNV